jgi:hypothetical protein
LVGRKRVEESESGKEDDKCSVAGKIRAAARHRPPPAGDGDDRGR